MPRLHPLPANALTFLVIALACLAVWYVLKPAPPSRIMMSTGVPTGAYAKFGHRYAEFLARDGIEVALRPSAGAIENLERLVKEVGCRLLPERPVQRRRPQGPGRPGQPVLRAALDHPPG